MIKKGDIVVFHITFEWTKRYKVASDIYRLHGKEVVDLENYPGEVAVEYLEKAG